MEIIEASVLTKHIITELPVVNGARASVAQGLAKAAVIEPTAIIKGPVWVC